MTGYIIGLEEVEAKLHRQRRLFLMRWNLNIYIYIYYGVFLDHFVKKLAEFVCHKENFSNFAFGN